MLSRTPGGAELVVCTTCRVSADQPGAGGRAGQAMLQALAEALPGHAAERLGLSLQPMPCLFACASACTVHLRAPGRIAYLLGRMEPDARAAQALLDYAAAYLRAPEGRDRALGRMAGRGERAIHRAPAAGGPRVAGRPIARGVVGRPRPGPAAYLSPTSFRDASQG